MLDTDVVLRCIMQMYINYNTYVQGRNQESFMAGEVLAKKGAIYARHYCYIMSVIYNTLISVTKLGRIAL